VEPLHSDSAQEYSQPSGMYRGWSHWTCLGTVEGRGRHVGR